MLSRLGCSLSWLLLLRVHSHSLLPTAHPSATHHSQPPATEEKSASRHSQPPGSRTLAAGKQARLHSAQAARQAPSAVRCPLPTASAAQPRGRERGGRPAQRPQRHPDPRQQQPSAETSTSGRAGEHTHQPSAQHALPLPHASLPPYIAP